jgi:regulatory helix-turn-helix LysR family protein
VNGSAIKMTQLRYARAVVERGSFSQTAVSLGLTQPALFPDALERADESTVAYATKDGSAQAGRD